jgi:hypothetical protein
VVRETADAISRAMGAVIELNTALSHDGAQLDAVELRAIRKS